MSRRRRTASPCVNLIPAHYFRPDCNIVQQNTAPGHNQNQHQVRPAQIYGAILRNRATAADCAQALAEDLMNIAIELDNRQVNENRIFELDNLIRTLESLGVALTHADLCETAKQLIKRAKIFEIEVLSKQIRTLSKQVVNLAIE
jgi:hypothetical protein